MISKEELPKYIKMKDYQTHRNIILLKIDELKKCLRTKMYVSAAEKCDSIKKDIEEYLTNKKK